MPINQSLMKSLKKRYGVKKGEQIYYSMESEGSKATKSSAIKKSMKDHPQYYKVVLPKKQTRRK